MVDQDGNIVASGRGGKEGIQRYSTSVKLGNSKSNPTTCNPTTTQKLFVVTNSLLRPPLRTEGARSLGANKLSKPKIYVKQWRKWRKSALVRG